MHEVARQTIARCEARFKSIAHDRGGIFGPEPAQKSGSQVEWPVHSPVAMTIE